MIDVGEFQRQAQRRRDELGAELAELRAFRERHERERRLLAERRDEALRQLSEALLPDLSGPSVERARRLTAFPGLTEEAVTSRIAADRELIARRLGEIDADPRWRDRELLRAPRVGSLVRRLAELQEFREPFARAIATAEHPRLERLLQVEYGTESYAVPFWRLSYYQDWEAGDQIVERFPGMKTFAEVRQELLTARETLAVYDRGIAEAQAEIEAGEALERERTEQGQLLATLEARALASWRARLADHVQSVDPADLAARLAGEPDVALLVKKAGGLGAKLEYLDRIDGEAQRHQQGLHQELDKLLKDMLKYSRPKNASATFDEAATRHRFQERPARLRQRWGRTAHGYETVYVFSDWGRGSFARDFLWWDLMTDGRLDGDFIPEVAAHHREHRHLDADDDRVRAAAAAVAASERAADPSQQARIQDPS